MKNKFIIVITSIATTTCFSDKSTITQQLKNANTAWTSFYNAHNSLKTFQGEDPTRMVLLKRLEDWNGQYYSDDINGEMSKLDVYMNHLNAWAKANINVAGTAKLKQRLEALANEYIVVAQIYLANPHKGKFKLIA